MDSPTKEMALRLLMAPVEGITNGGLPVCVGLGSLFGTRKGFTHFGAAGIKEPVLAAEKAGL